MTSRSRPSKGCRSRKIFAEPEKTRGWVVFDEFFRHDSARPDRKGGGPPYGTGLGASVRETVAESPRGARRRDTHGASARTPARFRRLAPAGESVPALCIRPMDAKDVPSSVFREICG